MIMNGLSQGGGSDSKGPVIYTTSYVGTGTYGQNNPNTLTFDFVPEIVIILDGYNYKNYDKCHPIIIIPKLSTSTVYTKFDNNNYLHFHGLAYSYNDVTNTLSFYISGSGYVSNPSSGALNADSASSTYQCNVKNTTYNVLAIGYKEES